MELNSSLIYTERTLAATRLLLAFREGKKRFSETANKHTGDDEGSVSIAVGSSKSPNCREAAATALSILCGTAFSIARHHVLGLSIASVSITFRSQPQERRGSLTLDISCRFKP